MSRNSKGFGQLIKVLGILVGIWFVFSWIYSGLKSGDEKEVDKQDIEFVDYDDQDEDYDRPRPKDESFESIREDVLIGEFFVHEHEWADSKSNDYESVFKVKEGFLDRCTDFRDDLKSTTSFPKVYEELADFDGNKLDELIDMYDEIKTEEKLSQKEFADMVVTSIQNIPYALVHEHSHEKADELWGGYIEKYHEEGGPCVENAKFGILSPVEFMSSFLGDCDTRAVLCYLVLKDFGFDVAVLGSDKYGHAVLGISGNYRGSFVKKDGIRYYAWETTAVGYRPGVLSPDWSNMNYWSVDIASTD